MTGGQWNLPDEEASPGGGAAGQLSLSSKSRKPLEGSAEAELCSEWNTNCCAWTKEVPECPFGNLKLCEAGNGRRLRAVGDAADLGDVGDALLVGLHLGGGDG